MAEKFVIRQNRISGRNSTPNDGYTDQNWVEPEVSMDQFADGLSDNGFPMMSKGDKSMAMSDEAEGHANGT